MAVLMDPTMAEIRELAQTLFKSPAPVEFRIAIDLFLSLLEPGPRVPLAMKPELVSAYAPGEQSDRYMMRFWFGPERDTYVLFAEIEVDPGSGAIKSTFIRAHQVQEEGNPLNHTVRLDSRDYKNGGLEAMVIDLCAYLKVLFSNPT